MRSWPLLDLDSELVTPGSWPLLQPPAHPGGFLMARWQRATA